MVLTALGGGWQVLRWLDSSPVEIRTFGVGACDIVAGEVSSRSASAPSWRVGLSVCAVGTICVSECDAGGECILLCLSRSRLQNLKMFSLAVALAGPLHVLVPCRIVSM